VTLLRLLSGVKLLRLKQLVTALVPKFVVVLICFEVEVDVDELKGWYENDQGLLIDQKIDKFYHQIFHLDHLWFSCDTYKHSQISLCISLHFCGTRVLLAS